MIYWLLLVVTLILAYGNSWWWIAVAILALFKGFKWWFYRSRPWRRIHYPAMRAYSAAAGTETAAAENEGRNFNVKNALITLLGLLKPNWDEEQKTLFVNREMERARTYSDEPLIREAFRKSNTKANDRELNELMNTLSNSININDNGWMVRTVIAGLVEDQFGIDDRGEYLRECVSGNAK